MSHSLRSAGGGQLVKDSLVGGEQFPELGLGEWHAAVVQVGAADSEVRPTDVLVDPFPQVRVYWASAGACLSPVLSHHSVRQL
jgi:hypothetical protein